MKNNVSADDLQVFLAVLAEGGFRAAAKKLGVAPSKVSTTISRMEVQLGLPLLRRSTRSVHPTEQGETLAGRVGPLLSEIAFACADAARSTEEVRGLLRLNVPGAVMPDILPDLIIEFQSRHPKVEVDVVMDNNFVDIIGAGCDAGIRYGKSVDKDMISIPIGPRQQQFALAAAPSYLQEHGKPDHPSQLSPHNAIRYRLPDGTLLPWALRNAGSSYSAKPQNRLVLSVNSLNTGLSYARAGLGIIGTFRNWLDDDLRAGLLVPILPAWWAELEGPRLYFPSRLTSTPLRAFIEVCKSANRAL